MRPFAVLRLTVFLSVAAAGFSPAEAAICEVQRHSIAVAVDAEVDMIVASGQDCRIYFPKSEGFQAERGEIGDRPYYGGVRMSSNYAVYYRSNPGYKGPDRFSFTLCGAEGDRRGCSEVRVKVRVR